MENTTKSQGGGVSSTTKQGNITHKISEKVFTTNTIEKNYQFKVGRKLIHITFSLFGFSLLFAPAEIHIYVKYLMYLMCIGAILADTIRIFVPWINQFIYKYLSSIFIERDAKRYSSGTYYLIGISLATLLYPTQIAGLAIIFLGIGDSIASVTGTYLKKYIPITLPFSHKTAVGSISFILLTTAIGYIANMPFLACLIASFGAAMAEVYLYHIDDNLTIPIIGGGLLYLMMG